MTHHSEMRAEEKLCRGVSMVCQVLEDRCGFAFILELSVAGGICQLSNALYACALEAGFAIHERHAHTRIIPGSMVEPGRDATDFWNYVDLRFSSRRSFRIGSIMTAADLIVQFWTFDET